MAARVHDAIAVERAVDVTPPPPPPPDPAPTPEPAVAAPRSRDASRAQRARPAAPAAGGQARRRRRQRRSISPDSAFVVGSGSTYAGGSTTSAGTSRTPAHGAVAPGGTGDGTVRSSKPRATQSRSTRRPGIAPGPRKPTLSRSTSRRSFSASPCVPTDARNESMCSPIPASASARPRVSAPCARAFEPARDSCGSARCSALASHSRPFLPVSRMRRRLVITFVAIAALAPVGCGRHKATTEDCRAVLDRIIELELSESGYRDAVLRARWKSDFGRRFAPDLRRCQGLRVKNDLRRCLVDARSPDEIVHQCLD